MRRIPKIHDQIWTFYERSDEAHGRSRSWEHCFRYFHESNLQVLLADRHHAALQLGFYLASWGMYRGSSFLLQHDYTIHLGVVTALAAQHFEPLWQGEFGSGQN